MRASRQGFSLVEVVVALAVVSLAVLTVVGMLSGALLNFSDSEQKTAVNQIHDQVLHDVQQQEWTTPSGGVPTLVPLSPLYFDAQADLLSSSTGAIYQVTVVPAASPVSVPSSSGGSAQFVDNNSNPSLTTVTTSIYRFPGPTTTPLNWFTDYVSRN